MSNSTSDFLSKIPVFQGLAQEELVDILRTLQPVSYQAGEIIFREDDEGKGAFIIQEGKIEIFISNAQKSLTVTRLHAGDIFGELALIDGAPRSAGARTLTQCTFLFIEKREFDYLRRQLRPAAFHLLRIFSNELCVRIRETNEQIESILMGVKAEQRGGTVVISARNESIEQVKKEEISVLSRFFSLFKSV
jgi:CRP-like cAMP-binding protein